MGEIGEDKEEIEVGRVVDCVVVVVVDCVEDNDIGLDDDELDGFEDKFTTD